MRLQQLSQTFPKIEASKRSKFGDHIFIEHIADAVSLNLQSYLITDYQSKYDLKHDYVFNQDQMVHCLRERLPILLSQRKIGLIVLDSIAGIFRGSYSLETCVQRAETIRSVGSILHALAMKHNICIICINQV